MLELDFAAAIPLPGPRFEASDPLILHLEVVGSDVGSLLRMAERTPHTAIEFPTLDEVLQSSAVEPEVEGRNWEYLLSASSERFSPEALLGKSPMARMSSAPQPPEPPEDEVVVTGKRPKTTDDDPYDPGTSGDPGTGGPGWTAGGGGAGGISEDPPEEDEQDCRDRKALDAERALETEPDKRTHENALLVYKDSNGVLRNSGVVQGGRNGIPQSAFEAEMARLGIGRGDIVAMVHNHPYDTYGDAPEVNSYPSGGRVAGGDWATADWFVDGGAGGPGGDGFALYVVDTANHMREFNYADRAYWKDLNYAQREQERGLPDVMRDEGGSC